MYVIPLSTAPNNRFRCMIPIGETNEFLEFFMHYNEIAEYWVMNIFDDTSGKCLVSSLPLLTANYPAANILEQQSHLDIGSAVIVPVGGEKGEPNDENLGIKFFLFWSETI